MVATRKLTLATDGERTLVIERSFNAPREMVFDAYTIPALVRRWLLGPPGWTMPVCEIDLRVGGKFRYVWANADGREMGMGGTFTEVVRPERLANREIFDEDWTGGETLGTMVLTERDGVTHMRHTVIYSSEEAMKGAMQTGMAEGLEAGYQRLDEIFAEPRG